MWLWFSALLAISKLNIFNWVQIYLIFSFIAFCIVWPTISFFWNILTKSICANLLNLVKKRTGANFVFFIIRDDKDLLVYIVDKISILLSFIFKKKYIVVKNNTEPYLSNKLITRISLGNKNSTTANKRQIYIPLFFQAIYLNEYNLDEIIPRFSQKIKKNQIHNRRIIDERYYSESFSGVIFSGKSYSIRELIVNAISEVIPVAKYGKAYNKPFQGSKHLLQKEHLFCICPENSIREGYCSEKVVEAYLSGYIPIYWNHPKNIEGIINKNAIINLYGLDKEQIKQKIIEITTNRALLKDIYESPLFDKNFNIEKIIQEFELNFIEALYN